MDLRPADSTVAALPSLFAGPPDSVAAMLEAASASAHGIVPAELCGGRWALAVTEPNRLARRGRYGAAILGAPHWDEDAFADRQRSAGPAEAFVLALERYGEDALAHIHGKFAAAWVDEAAGTLSLAIDRAGMESLYWCPLADGRVAAASRADLASVTAGEPPEIDPVSLYNYLFYYCIPGPRTIFRNTHRLLPAQALRFGAGEPDPRRYWRMPYADADVAGRDPADWHPLIRRTLSAAVARARESAEGTSGAFLSGGLDSSTIAGLLAERWRAPKTFTIRFHERAYDEGDYARLAAEHFGTDHHERYVLPEDVAPVMDRLARLCDQPYGNTSVIAAYHCAAAGRAAGVGTMIAGDGGDELFAGNERYLLVRRCEIYGRIPLFLRRGLLDPLLAPPMLNRIPVVARAHQLRRRYAMSLPERMFADHHPFHSFSLEEVVAPDLLAELSAHDPVALAETAFEEADGGDELQRLMAVDLKLTIADNDLVKVARACELAGVEVRFPMLDTEVMELAARIRSDQMLAGGRLRGLFKDAMAGFLPEAILTKPKQGFGLPFKRWVGEHAPLREKVLDALRDLRSRNLFTERYLDALERACRPSEAGDLRGNAWDAAMFELWLQAHGHSL